MSEPIYPEPVEVAELVERFVTNEHDGAQRFRSPLDDSGVYDLHTIAARIYAMGHEDGLRLANARRRGARDRADRTETVEEAS